MGFMGMRGTGDWVANQRPESWREAILKLYPNGAAPLTAMMSKMRSERTSDPHFHWWEKLLPDQRGAISAIADQVPAAYVNGGAIGLVLSVTVGASYSKFIVGHQVMLRRSSVLADDVMGKVTAIATNVVDVTLLEADPGGAVAPDVIVIIGTLNSEGAGATTSLMYDPTELSNLTQIFRNTLEHTRTATQTKLRTGDQVKESKREGLLLHGIEMEKAFIMGRKTNSVGANGKPERSTDGIISFLSTNVEDYLTTAIGVAGPLTWANGGEFWLDTVFEQIFRYGGTEKLAYCGSGALLGINRLAKNYGRFELTAAKKDFGIQVLSWLTPFGTIHLKTHPLFSYEPTMRNTMLIIEPSNLIYRYVADTKYNADIQANDIDGEKSEYLTEAGLELHFEQSMGILRNVGIDRP